MKHDITLTVNGTVFTRSVEPRLLLSDFLRDDLMLTGTNVGCEQGVCGSCTVQVDGQAVRSCLMLAIQADNLDIRTVESLAVNGALSDLQQCFHENHALQCGFCTPGILMSLDSAYAENSTVSLQTDEEIVRFLDGHLCRCTGYRNIVKAVRVFSEKRK